MSYVGPIKHAVFKNHCVILTHNNITCCLLYESDMTSFLWHHHRRDQCRVMDLETSGGILDEDVATQFMIEQSLLEGHKQSEAKKTSSDVGRIIPISPEREKIFNAIKHGKNILLKIRHQMWFKDQRKTNNSTQNFSFVCYPCCLFPDDDDPGDEGSLRKLTVQRHAFSEEDDTGFIPLHEAATQSNQNILDITFSGLSWASRFTNLIHLLIVSISRDEELYWNFQQHLLRSQRREGLVGVRRLFS